ncbi:extracellular solute-binding protein, partial [Castellaniella sp.]|uniref:extracellular solute-binding protein n=1 Tax=Castellaniella sp. TaxID=1955812 RepID=UPI003564070F
MTSILGAKPAHIGQGLAGVLLAAVLAGSAHAAVKIPLWHSLQGHNADVLQDLVRSWNRSQSDVDVSLRQFDTPEALDQALNQAAGAKKLPALAQIGNTHTLDHIAKRPYVQPFHLLQGQAAFKGADWFLATDNAFVHDAKGRLMAFPYMLEIPVMYYNQAAFQKAGLTPTEPARIWIDLQGQLVALANKGSRTCPLTSNLPVSINLENLAAVNNQFYAGADNGLTAKGLPSFSFNSTYVRHLSLMISWVRSEIMTRPDAGLRAVSRFAEGECAVLMSDSGHIGEFDAQRKLQFAVSGLPYYPEVTRKPGNPFVNGSALWVMKSDKAVTDATVTFLGWLAKPEQAARWYQETGYLPLTKAAFNQTPENYYRHLGAW